MSTLLIGSAVVVVSTLGVAYMLFGHRAVPGVISSGKPVTVQASAGGAMPHPENEQGDPLRIPLPTRLRSLVLLVLLSIGLACVAATVAGGAVLTLSFLLD